jgi:hypothetical protein
MGRRRQHFCRRWHRQCAGRQIQQQGRVHQVLALEGNRARSVRDGLAIAVDRQGNVYVADGGNKRIQVFDNNGTFKTQYTNVGTPAALCITPGPNKFLYSSDSNPPDDIDVASEIYKMKLDGTIVGKFGRVGKLSKEFSTVNAIGCRGENNLLVGEIGNMRVQKLALH